MNKEKSEAMEPYFEQYQDEDKLLISKSYPFLSLTKTSALTLQELKILDCFLARINPTDPKSTSVRFSKGELEHLCGGKRIRKNDLIERLRHLCTNVTLYDPNDPDKFKVISLFEEAVAALDPETATWVVDLQCTEKAKRYIFNMPQYLRYELQRVMNLRSRYAYALFLYLRRNSFRKKWRESLPNLRKELSCDEPTYEEFRYLNYKILRPCQMELAEKSDCQFTYAPCTSGGKKVVAVEFEYFPSHADNAEAQIFQSQGSDCFEEYSCDTVSDNDPAACCDAESAEAASAGESAPELSDYEECFEDPRWTDCEPLLDFMHGIAPEFDFEEMTVLAGLVFNVPDELKPIQKYLDDPYFSPAVLSDQAYFSDKVDLLAQYEKKGKAQGRPIKDRFMYLKRMIENDMRCVTE